MSQEILKSRHLNQQVADYFANKLCRYLAASNITVEELAGKLGCTPLAISHWMRGNRLPTGSLLFALCTAIKISPNVMLGWRVKK